jgi:hypothetical protein
MYVFTHIQAGVRATLWFATNNRHLRLLAELSGLSVGLFCSGRHHGSPGVTHRTEVSDSAATYISSVPASFRLSDVSLLVASVAAQGAREIVVIDAGPANQLLLLREQISEFAEISNN